MISLIKKPKDRLLLIFLPDFTSNGQMWLFYAQKWIFLKKLGTVLYLTNSPLEILPKNAFWS